MTFITAVPTLTTQYLYARDSDLPSLAALSTSSYSIPSVSVPPNDDNPYILTTNDPSGTVFIAFGAIVGAILVGFILYHLWVSLLAAKRAKKAVYDDKQIYENYQNNNTTAYGLSPSTTMTFGQHHAVSKLPLLLHQPTKSFTGLTGSGSGSGSQLGDTSTLYQSETGAVSKHDLTKMFISPTAEVMQHKRAKSSQYQGSVNNLNLFNGSSSNLTALPAGNRHSSVIPSLYMNNDANNSDYSLSTNNRSQTGSQPNLSPVNLSHLAVQGRNNSALNVKSNRKTIPSMYLEDLIDE